MKCVAGLVYKWPLNEEHVNQEQVERKNNPDDECCEAGGIEQGIDDVILDWVFFYPVAMRENCSNRTLSWK